MTGLTLMLAAPFGVAAIWAPNAVVAWGAMAITLVLSFMCMGPVNAAMANVLSADLRGRGFAVSIFLMHVFGDAISPSIIGRVSDGVGGLRLPLTITAGLFLFGFGGVDGPSGVASSCRAPNFHRTQSVKGVEHV